MARKLGIFCTEFVCVKKNKNINCYPYNNDLVICKDSPDYLALAYIFGFQKLSTSLSHKSRANASPFAVSSCFLANLRAYLK